MKPTVSVIMPVFNQEKYVAATIESVLSQTFTDYEFIILDDGSTDNSAQIIREYAYRGSKIIPIFSENKGRSAATNNAVALATSDWCLFLDSDDTMLPDRIDKQLSFHLAHPEVDASSSHVHYVDEKGNNFGTSNYPYLKSVKECIKTRISKKIVTHWFPVLVINKSVI